MRLVLSVFFPLVFILVGLVAMGIVEAQMTGGNGGGMMGGMNNMGMGPRPMRSG